MAKKPVEPKLPKAPKPPTDQEAMVSQAVSDSIVKVVVPLLNLLQENPHRWGRKPCKTCRAISDLVGQPFGCEVGRVNKPKTKDDRRNIVDKKDVVARVVKVGGPGAPVLCADGKMGLLLITPTEGADSEDLCGVQVPGEEGHRWISCEHLSATDGGAFRQEGCPIGPPMGVGDDMRQMLLAMSFDECGGLLMENPE